MNSKARLGWPGQAKWTPWMPMTGVQSMSVMAILAN